MVEMISRNFALEEFLISQTAERLGIDMTPDENVRDHLKILVDSIMQPLRDEVGPLLVSSGYRPPELNSRIGGSKTSAHMYGGACDFRSNLFSPLDLCKKIVELDLPYDQVIHEFGRWVHVGIPRIGAPARGQELTASKRVNGSTVYTPGLHKIDLKTGRIA